ncbi:uncharacterized protein [Thunnus thynnus]|uniref:uncharacterized protein n=1 Tax=Thunnus thynnus TaxID=8237 RepID=UPI003527D1C0
MLTLPSHTSHCLQPLDKTVYGPLRTYYNRAMDGWMRTNPGKTATIYDIPGLVKEAFMSAMTPRNIISGFKITGIFPFNRDIFPDEDYAPSMVTDRSNPEEPSNCADLSVPSTHAMSSDCSSAVPDPDEPLATLPEPLNRIMNPEHSSVSDATGSPAHLGYVSPGDILPLPKATATKPRMKRKIVKTKILTDTPEKLEATNDRENKKTEKEKKKTEKEEKKALKGSKQIKSKKKSVDYSSSKESDINISVYNTNDYDSSEDDLSDDDSDKNLSAGDFVIVNFVGKNKSYNYIGSVEKVEGADISTKFLRQSRGSSVDGKPTFTFKENDEGLIPGSDVLKRLPRSQKLHIHIPLQH